MRRPNCTPLTCSALNASTLLDRGERAIKELSMAKSFSVQAGFRAVDRAIQTFGGMGLTNEIGLDRDLAHAAHHQHRRRNE